MKNTIQKFKYIIFGVLLVIGATAVQAVQISVPSANGSGFFLQSSTTGQYLPVSLTAGSNITIATTSSNVTISSTGGGGSGFGEAWTLGTNIFSQSMLAPTTTQNIHVSGTGTSTFIGGLEAWRQVAFPYFYATSTTATSTIKNALQIGSTAGDNALNITAGRTYPASISTGGMVNFTNTSNDGAGLVLYTNHGSGATGRLFVANCANSAFDQDCALISNTGANTTALNIQNFATGKGGLKLEQKTTGSDANASALSIDVGAGGGGTAAQGIFLDATNGGTTGKLLNIRNAGTEYLTMTSSGNIGLASSSPFTKLSVAGTITANNINATSTTATSTFNGNVLISPNNDTTYGFNSWQPFEIVGSSNNPFQMDIVNRSTGAQALSSIFLGNDKTTNGGFTSSYYGGMTCAGSNYNTPGANAVRPNGCASFASDGPYSLGSAATNAASSTIFFQAGSGLDVSYDAALMGGLGNFILGTTTTRTVNGIASYALSTAYNNAKLWISSSTVPQIALEGGDADNIWNMRSIGNQFFLATSSPTTYATSSTAALRIDTNGKIIANCFSTDGSNCLGGTGTVTSVGITSTNSTLTFGSTPITTSGTFTADLNLGHTNTWTILQNFGAASTTQLTASGFFGLPNSATPSIGAIGALALDTTSNALVLATSTTGHFVVASATSTMYAFTASTTALVSGSTIPLAAKTLPMVVTAVWCKVSSGTSFVLNLSNAAGSSDTNSVTCTTTGAQTAITTNNTYAAYADPLVEFSTKTGDVGYLSVNILGYRTSD